MEECRPYLNANEEKKRDKMPFIRVHNVTLAREEKKLTLILIPGAKRSQGDIAMFFWCVGSFDFEYRRS